MFFRDLLAYGRILRKRWPLIVGLFVVTVGTTTCMFFVQKPLYRAWIKLQVEAPPPADVTLYSSFRYDEFRNELAYTRSYFIELLSDDGLAWRTLSQVETDLDVQEFMAQTTVEADPESHFVRVGVAADTPEEAQVLVTKLIEETTSYYGALQAQPTTASREFISEELDAVRIELAEAERALTQFKIMNKVGALDADIGEHQDLVLSLLISRDNALAQGRLQEVASYDQIITERQRQLQDLISLSLEYEPLVTHVKLTSETYNYLLSKEVEAKIKENQILNGGFIQILSPAQLPRRSIHRFSPNIILLSGVVSLIIGGILAFVWEYIETQLAGAEQAVAARMTSMTTSSS